MCTSYLLRDRFEKPVHYVGALGVADQHKPARWGLKPAGRGILQANFEAFKKF